MAKATARNNGSTDYAQLSLEELNEQETSLLEKLEEVRKAKKQRAKTQLDKLAADAGMTVAELIASAGIKAAAARRGTAKAKYQNPEDPTRTWSGKGRQPQWVKDQLAAGKQLEEFAIKE